MIWLSFSRKKFFSISTNDNNNNKYHKCLFSCFMSNTLLHNMNISCMCVCVFNIQCIMTNIVFITIISVNGVIFSIFFSSYTHTYTHHSETLPEKYDECHHLFVWMCNVWIYYYDYYYITTTNDEWVRNLCEKWINEHLQSSSLIGFPSAKHLTLWYYWCEQLGRVRNITFFEI